MKKKILINCCEGNEQYQGQCLKERCPFYVIAKQKVENRWPRIQTGFGNAHGEPKHENYLHQVHEDVQSETKNKI